MSSTSKAALQLESIRFHLYEDFFYTPNEKHLLHFLMYAHVTICKTAVELRCRTIKGNSFHMN